MFVLTEWKDIPGYENIYQASTDGQIRTAPGKITQNAKFKQRHWKIRVLKQKVDKDGYRRVSLWKNAKEKDRLVHRLVAETFIPKIGGKNLINHIDGNPSNNDVSNLEWCNYSENLIHAYKHHLNCENSEVVLVNKNTFKAKYFYSLSSASEFLGKNHGFLSEKLKRKVNEIDEYLVFVRR
ncbi:HNH endonuclease [Lentilactobacillus farraginis DSM 18382 = JCM 14108]|uniref:HNH endonuclease n=1 Tax=Lentilactobacillus farraginis DSM 18382 = JCM 14108 TaxID=1423743 RepID=A0A0R1VKY3_9LACO|nr:HNH endonuclease [Lentilactobacillus farraginis DSM 18382 = JCM 14108]